MKKFLIFMGIFVIVAPILFIGGAAIYLRNMNVMDVSELSAYNHWMNETIEYPAHYDDVKPFSDETLQLAQEFVRIYSENKANKEMDWNELHEVMSQLVVRPDYSIEALSDATFHYNSNQGNYLFSFVDYNSLRILWDYESDQIHEALHQNKLRDAIDILSVKMGSLRVTSSGTLMDYLVGISGQKKMATDLQSCLDACVSMENHQSISAILSKYQKAQKWLKKDESFLTVDQLGILCHMKRKGLSYDLHEKTGGQIYALAALSEADYLEQNVLEEVSEAKKIKQIENMIKSYRSLSVMFNKDSGMGLHNIPVISEKMRQMFFKSAKVNVEKIFTSQKQAQVLLDLMILASVQKGSELENKSDLQYPSNLVSKWIMSIPSDRYSPDEKPYQFNGEYFYSIGPDGIDQKGKTPLLSQCDAVLKGIQVQTGDIYLAPRQCNH